jgi:hypothetical protein
MPLKMLSPSDHRTIFVDFDTTLLFGSLPSKLASPKAKAIHSRDYETSETYIKHVHAYCDEHDFYQRSEPALLSTTPQELNRLDDAVEWAMNAGLKAVTKRYHTPFTPEMRQARLSRHFFNLHMQQFKIGCNRSKALANVSAKLDTALPAPPTRRECHLRLSAIQKTIRKLRKEARQQRQDFLTRRVNFKCGGDSEKAAKIRV